MLTRKEIFHSGSVILNVVKGLESRDKKDASLCSA